MITILKQTTKRDSGYDEKFSRRYKTHFFIATDDASIDERLILAHPLIPQPGAFYPNDGGSILKQRHCDSIDAERNYWVVTCEYDSGLTCDPSRQHENPLMRKADVHWSTQPQQVPAMVDVNGQPVVASSNERYGAAPEFIEDITVLTITRNELVNPAWTSYNFRGAINKNDQWFFYRPHQCRIHSISGPRCYEAGISFYRVTYEIHMKRGGESLPAASFNTVGNLAAIAGGIGPLAQLLVNVNQPLLVAALPNIQGLPPRTFFYPHQTWDVLVLDQGYRDADGKLFIDPLFATPFSCPTLMNGRGHSLIALPNSNPGARTTLNGAVTAGQDTITVTDGSTNFPLNLTPPNYFMVMKVEDEYMLVYGGYGTNIWQVKRGWQGSTRAAHADTTAVAMQPYYKIYQMYDEMDFNILNLSID